MAAWLLQQLSLQHKKPLVSGYTRENYGKLISLDVMRVVRWYLDEVIYWCIKENSLKKFISTKVGKILYGSRFNYENIEFCGYWYPNGNCDLYNHCIIFGVCLTKLPKYIDTITIYYRLQCSTFNCLWKSIHSFKQNTSIQNNCIGWNPFLLNASQFNNCNIHKLDFNCYVNVIRIKYIHNDNDSICIEPNLEKNSIEQITKYSWDVNKNELMQFKTCNIGKTFHSQNFGFMDNWSLFIAPKGWKDNKNLMLYLRLLKLPSFIKSMIIKFSVKCMYCVNKTKKIKESKFSNSMISYEMNESTKQCLKHEISSISSITSLSFIIKIDIQHIYDMNDILVPNKDWAKYGIIANNNLTKMLNLFRQPIN